MQSPKEKGTPKVFREAGQLALLSCRQCSHPALTDHVLYDVCLLTLRVQCTHYDFVFFLSVLGRESWHIEFVFTLLNVCVYLLKLDILLPP